MEDVYPRVARTDTRELYLRDLGRSRVVYIPWDIDRTFWEVMCVDHGRLLQNAVAWAANEPPPVEVDGPGVLDVTVWRQRESMTVHLVNLTNPMMMKGPLREAIPVGPVRVGHPAARGHPREEGAAADGRDAPRVDESAGVLTVTVPSSTFTRSSRSICKGFSKGRVDTLPLLPVGLPLYSTNSLSRWDPGTSVIDTEGL